jgi:acyl-CoA thioester hydrolase
MEPIVTYRGLVFPWQCDHMGHMNVMWYVGKFDEATWNLLAEIGVTQSYLHDTHTGMAGVQQNITYKRETFAGTTVDVRSRLVSVGDRKLVLVHEMFHRPSNETCAVCELTAVHIDRVKRRATPFPAEIRRRAEEMIASPGGPLP